MIIADTSVWIEYLRGRLENRADFGKLVAHRQVLVIECIFGELLQGVRTDREAKIIQELWHNLPKYPDDGLWIAAGYLAFREKLLSKGIGLIDAAILVATKKSKARVWTLDKKLSSLLPSSLLFSPEM